MKQKRNGATKDAPREKKDLGSFLADERHQSSSFFVLQVRALSDVSAGKNSLQKPVVTDIIHVMTYSYLFLFRATPVGLTRRCSVACVACGDVQGIGARGALLQ